MVLLNTLNFIMRGGAIMATANESRIVRENSIVKVIIDYGDGDQEEMRARFVTRSMQLDDEITMDSPIGQAIYRKKEGDHIECKLPNGATAWVTIKEIEI